jgi:hypothetical protein
VSKALARARDRFEVTPRKLDDEALDRIARGDRGCLGDVLSGVGALVLVVTMILGAMGIIPWSWAYVGVALWVGGFVLGTYSQARSTKQRRAALEAGPLVLGTVLRDEPWLHRPGKQAGRVVVLFTTSPERRFDRAWLEASAAKLERQLAEPNDDPTRVPLRALLADRMAFGCHPVPPDLRSEAVELWLASAVIHPDRLEGGYLGGEDDREAAEQGLEIDGPGRPPAVLLFVDPPRGFVEHVP